MLKKFRTLILILLISFFPLSCSSSEIDELFNIYSKNYPNSKENFTDKEYRLFGREYGHINYKLEWSNGKPISENSGYSDLYFDDWGKKIFVQFPPNFYSFDQLIYVHGNTYLIDSESKFVGVFNSYQLAIDMVTKKPLSSEVSDNYIKSESMAADVALECDRYTSLIPFEEFCTYKGMDVIYKLVMRLDNSEGRFIFKEASSVNFDKQPRSDLFKAPNNLTMKKYFNNDED